MPKMKLNAHIVRLNLRKLNQWIWIARYWILLAVIVTFLSHRLFVHLWYLELPKNVPSIICSFGKGKLHIGLKQEINRDIFRTTW